MGSAPVVNQTRHVGSACGAARQWRRQGWARGASCPPTFVLGVIFFFAFIRVIFLRYHEIMKVFRALNLKVFPKYLLLIK